MVLYFATYNKINFLICKRFIDNLNSNMFKFLKKEVSPNWLFPWIKTNEILNKSSRKKSESRFYCPIRSPRTTNKIRKTISPTIKQSKHENVIYYCHCFKFDLYYFIIIQIAKHKVNKALIYYTNLNRYMQ